MVVVVHTKTGGDVNTAGGAATVVNDGLIDGTTVMGILVAGIGAVCLTGSMNGTGS